ncbi:hypothetical protein GH810_05875 [Acetobacterium paludosum]|uniref:Uncharacterized protein n=1 Tax=Acetobacterium paludosum TaxID=52693 RepID=A0A923HSE5_9FIRM|nr:hypothetical protein [Acetobacterium paludosum]MBC3887834.1 hypothetical protein [Acetobacterium paludosum]
MNINVCGRSWIAPTVGNKRGIEARRSASSRRGWPCRPANVGVEIGVELEHQRRGGN